MCGICTGWREERRLEESLLGQGSGWSSPGGGRAEPVRVRSGVCQGPSRQQTPSEPARAFRMAEQRLRSGSL